MQNQEPLFKSTLKVTCSACGGSGEDDSIGKKCVPCKGTGEVIARRPQQIGDDNVPDDEP